MSEPTAQRQSKHMELAERLENLERVVNRLQVFADNLGGVPQQPNPNKDIPTPVQCYTDVIGMLLNSLSQLAEKIASIGAQLEEMLL